MPLISICIPAYKNTEFLCRLLDSIIIQTFKDFEVIISDDSADDSIEGLVNKYETKLNISYYKNAVPLGTPANWNFAISKASGKWIKIMHYDDWFANENSLNTFASVAKRYSDENVFIFSGFNEIKSNHIQSTYIVGSIEELLLKKSPLNLLKKNFIGHPSTTLIKNNVSQWYDEKIKWVVDIEFYIRYLKNSNFIAINKALVNIGISNEQVTKKVFRNPKIEVPENLYLLKTLAHNSLNNVFVYDYYWRLFRNLNIRSFEQLKPYTNDIKLPDKLKKMLRVQFKLPLPVLKIGILSKFFMIVTKTFV